MVDGVGANRMAGVEIGTKVGAAPAEDASGSRQAEGAATDPKFADVWKQIQSKYGAKPEKPREIKKTLGKDDFLKIMITQMRHQDPTQPFKAEQMASEIAQFTSVEQLQNLNKSMEKMQTQNHPLERLAMTNLIGKTITVDKERFPHVENQADTLGFQLPQDAKQVTVSILNETGETVFSKDMGDLKAGENTFGWDGIRTNTLPAKSGNYIFRVDAKDDRGMPITIATKSQTQVVGVSFEGTEPVLLVGNPSQPEKVTMRNVVRIDGGNGGGVGSLIPGARPLGAGPTAMPQPGAPAAPSAQVAQNTPNLIKWEKGVGSRNMDANELSGAAAQAYESLAQSQAARMAAAQQQAQAQAPGADKAAPEEKGFPNGLSNNE